MGIGIGSIREYIELVQGKEIIETKDRNKCSVLLLPQSIEV